jgi:hypothetical protein
MAEAGSIDYLVSGDKRGALTLKMHGATHIVRARDLLNVLSIKPAQPTPTPKRRR